MSNKKHTVNIKDGNKKENDKSKNGSDHEEYIKTNDAENNTEENNKNKENETAVLKDMLLRKAAEFENYKRRTDQEISNYIKYASENIIKELLPVYDDLGRSIDSINKGETKDFETLKKGILLIFDKFKNILEKEGLTEINSLGQEFNVDVNSALMQVPRDDVKPNTVLEVVEKGYKLKDKVVKHEKVLVSAEPL
ncbi:MAG: nucleotide exchange factor GrpE [Ignavibacteria bacterium]|nr:nucleotide exchange factor GrpE [Ignavibacteria bacterium]MBK7158354.1 nucleotide exchange factor GrpE [Ignavibacteria bacterium]MBK7446417.1 nucleotide exchange factor GrpE [Ignavibacteria bacterium]MBK9405106.1 nucleotide exchange factor GrpE [Ignavibacteria bacterium]MBL0106827.1 nucleotide exchange factor GrpE [Ignavibacteria bacterium]